MKAQFWQNHYQGTKDLMNRTMVVVCDDVAELNAIDPNVLIYVDTGDGQGVESSIITEGTIAFVNNTGDFYRMNASGTFELMLAAPRYISPTSSNFSNAIQINNDLAVTPSISANVGQAGFAWIPAVITTQSQLKGSVAVKFNVTDSSAIVCPISGNTGTNTVKLMYKVSTSSTPDIDNNETFETNGYTALYTLTGSGGQITSRERLFGSSSNNAQYYNIEVNKGEYIHFAWYLEKTSEDNVHLRFGEADGTTPTGFVKDNTLTNAFNGVSLQHNRTLLEVGLTAEIQPEANKRYYVVVPEAGSTFNPSSPNSNVDYFVFNGSDVTYSTTVSSPLASKWEVDVANVTSDLNLGTGTTPLTFAKGEIRSMVATSSIHGFTVDGVNLQVSSSAIMVGEAFS